MFMVVKSITCSIFSALGSKPCISAFLVSNMFTRWKFQIGLIAIAAALAVLTGAFLDERVAHAQGEDGGHVDVGIFLEVPHDIQSDNSHKLKIIVVNQGSRTAYDVEVVVAVGSPAQSHLGDAAGELPEVPFGSATLDGTALIWNTPALGRLQREQVTAKVSHVIYEGNIEIKDNSEYPHELFGEVTTSSYDSNLSNNTARVWSYDYSTSDANTRQVLGNYSVSVSVDDQNPSPGDTVNFTITADRANPYTGSTGDAHTPPPIDLKVEIELTDGLTVTGTPTYAPATNRADSVSYSNGVFTIGTLQQGKSRENSVTLPITVASSGTVNEQCLTAKLTGNPPPGIGPHDDDISDNVAKECLGEPPVEPFVSSQIAAFTIYPCVGNTNPPCDDTDDVRVRAVRTTDERVLEAGKAVVHIPEEATRTYDSHANSVNAGTIVSWKTTVIWNADELDDVNTQWSNLRDGFTASGTNGGDPPGRVHIRAFEDKSYEVIYKMTPDTTPQWTFEDTVGLDPGSSNGPHDYIAEFEKLGTYKIEFTVKLTRATPDGDENCDPNSADPPVNQRFCATETYVFHVGPVAELEVSDGAAAANRSELTIAVLNNGPNHSPGVQVTGLPTGAEVIYKSQGTYDGSTGVWDVGELKFRDYLRSRGEADPILVLGATAGDTANVSITNHEKYKVCIGSDASTLAHDNEDDCKSDPAADTWHAAVCVNNSDQTINTTATHDTQTECAGQTGHTWTIHVCATSAGKVTVGRPETECHGRHEGTACDYKPDNNTATIRARGGGASGTRGAGSGGPMAPRFANTAVLNWEAVPHVNDWPVHRYQVQYLNGDNWLDLAEVAGSQTQFPDTGAGSGRAYRVRAVNEAGVPGFWSRSASRVTYRQASPPLNVSAEVGKAGEIIVSWEASSDDGGSTITHYQVQWSRNGTSGWSSACRTDNASQHTCTATGIPSGETRYYRVAAYAGGLGAWSDLAVATTMDGLPEAPRLSTSDATRGSGDDVFRAIRLTWNEPRDNGSPIYSYYREWVDYDQDARACGDDWEPLGAVGDRYSGAPTREYLDDDNGNGLWAGVTRCYRVQAINSAGAWSNVVQRSTGAVPPEQVYLDGEADGQEAITLYWDELYHDGGAPVTGYQLQHSADGENWSSLTSAGASVWYYTHTGRKVGEPWHYRIRARNSAGWSEWSYPIAVSIVEGTTVDIAQPSSFTVQAKTSTEILLSWSKLCDPNLEDDCENKGVDGYYVEYSEDGRYAWEDFSFWPDQTAYVHSSLEPGTTLYYRVAGYDTVDGRWVFGRRSQVKKATTADFVVGAPQNFTIVAEGERAQAGLGCG